MRYGLVKTECCNVHKSGGSVGSVYHTYNDVNMAYRQLTVYNEGYVKRCVSGACVFEVKETN